MRPEEAGSERASASLDCNGKKKEWRGPLVPCLHRRNQLSFHGDLVALGEKSSLHLLFSFLSPFGYPSPPVIVIHSVPHLLLPREDRRAGMTNTCPAPS